MPKIEFIKDHIVKQGDGKGPVYKPGDVVDVAISYAEKYKRKGLAIDHVAKPKAAAPAVVEPAPAPAVESRPAETAPAGKPSGAHRR